MAAAATSTVETRANPTAGMMIDKHMTTEAPTALSHGIKYGEKRPEQPEDKFEEAVNKLLGPTGKHMHLAPLTSVNLDLREGFAHQTTGLPYALHGTASVINKTVVAGLLGTKDPIHAILKTSVQSTAKVIIKRKYVVGGAATITPERAPARTVAIKEDVREIEMNRYGADIEMNLNLFLRPDEAREELDLKLGAQRMHLEAKLIELGYEAIMDHGTNIVDGIMRSNPAYRKMDLNGGDAPTAVRLATDRIYSQQIFGAMAKNAYPIPNLLAATRYASAYTIGNIQNAVMILPHGVGDLMKFTRQESMVYDIAGIPSVEGKSVTMELENTFVDPVSGTRILVHHGAPSLTTGSINPVPKVGGLTDEVEITVHYANLAATDYIVDWSDGSLVQVSKLVGEEGAGTTHSFTRTLTAVMSSAIIAAPNGDAGELLVGYPMTGVSTSQATETLRLQLRTYMGCAITNPESVFVLPNVSFEGLLKGYKATDFNAGLPGSGDGRGGGPIVMDAGVSHHGTVYGEDRKIKIQNTGHLGCLDSPEGVPRMWGARVFSSAPNPKGNC